MGLFGEILDKFIDCLVVWMGIIDGMGKYLPWLFLYLHSEQLFGLEEREP